MHIKMNNRTTFKNVLQKKQKVLQYQMAKFNNVKPQLLLHQPNSECLKSIFVFFFLHGFSSFDLDF